MVGTLPAMHPLKTNQVTCAFGVPGSWMAKRHTGVDFRAPIGTPLFACLGGKVVFAGRGGAGDAYGNHIIIESTLDGRRVRMLYAHLDSINPLAKYGRRVLAGQRLGRTGDTGNTRGPHLHLELRNAPFNYWAYTDPAPALKAPGNLFARRRAARAAKKAAAKKKAK